MGCSPGKERKGDVPVGRNEEEEKKDFSFLFSDFVFEVGILVGNFVKDFCGHTRAHICRYKPCMVYLDNFNMKMLKFLTIQNPDFRQFSVSGFAVALKPNEP